jgi:hypothetical protein
MIGTRNPVTTTAALTFVLLIGATCCFGKDKDGTVVLRGAIADSQCAFNVHSNARSHEWMIKKGVPGASDDKSCTQHCVKDMGGNYVLVVKDDVYRLDDQGQAEPFAGKKVKATGTVDAKTHTLHVLKIEEDQ